MISAGKKYLSHLELDAGFDRMHFAFAVEQGAQAAPHFAVGGVSRSDLVVMVYVGWL